MIYYRVIALLFLSLSVSCSSVSSYKIINKEGFEEGQEIKEQSKFLVSSMANASRKLHDIAWPIMISNLDSCQNSKINAFGLMIAHLEDIPSSLAPSFYAASPINSLINSKADLPMIVSVAKDIPADRAKIIEGDLIISINNSIVSYKNYKRLLDDAAQKGSLKIRIKRLEEKITYELESELICGYPVQAMISPIPNAYADGSKIYITIATLDFIKDDQEIAFLIAHELAHNIHHYKGEALYESQGNPLAIEEKPSLQKITDLLIFQTEEKETEADLYGVEFAIKAGIAQDKVANYFRRLTIYMPQLMKNSFFRMHPGNAKRVADIERKLKELNSN